MREINKKFDDILNNRTTIEGLQKEMAIAKVERDKARAEVQRLKDELARIKDERAWIPIEAELKPVEGQLCWVAFVAGNKIVVDDAVYQHGRFTGKSGTDIEATHWMPHYTPPPPLH